VSSLADAMSEEKWMNKGMMGGKWRGLRSTRGPMLSLLFVMRSGTMIYNGGFSFDMRVILYKSPLLSRTLGAPTGGSFR